MGSKMGPVIRQMHDAMIAAARHTDELPGLARLHKTQLVTMSRRIKAQDTFDGKPSTHGGPSTSWKDTNRGANWKRTFYDTEGGRPSRESGRINEDFGSSRRGDNATAIGREGGRGYDGGHLGAHRFFGDTPDEGIAPQASNLNRGPWKTMENEWADWANNGYSVDYVIDVQPPGARVPDSFSVEYLVTDPKTGEHVHHATPRFDNNGGESFRRTPREIIEGMRRNGE